MSRWLYALLFYLAMPFVWLRLLWRARQQPEYLDHLGERHGHYRQRPSLPVIWLHAVSVGETRAAEPLVESLLRRYPDHAVLLTHMTPTGRACGQEWVKRHPERLMQAYLPYDLAGAGKRFLDFFRPQLGLLMETEVWPNLIAAARQRGLPLALINARLSQRSQRGYLRLHSLIAPALASLDAIAAQTPEDAQRLMSIGASRVSVCGNLKFDVAPAPDKLRLGKQWRRALGPRPIWLAASTREGEEALILEAFMRINRPEMLLLLVPRHPQRFAEVAELVSAHGLPLRRRSDGQPPEASIRVWLGDSMGELAAYYALADVSLIGGTLRPFGGQNLIEATACGCPVLLGPHSFNFAQAAQDAIACGAARRVDDAADAATTVEELLDDSGQLQAMRAAARSFAQAHGGATGRVVALVETLMAPRAVS